MTIPHYSQLVYKQAKKHPHTQILFYRDASLMKWVGLTWQELEDCVTRTAAACIRLGIEEHNHVVICSQNKPQSLIVDFANFANRVVSVPVFATLSASQMAYIIKSSDAKLAFVGEQEQYDKVLSVIDTLPSLQCVVAFDENVDLKGEGRAMHFSQFLVLGDNEKLQKEVLSRRKSAKDTDLAILMYTSGTTGQPKGVMLSHANLQEAMRIHTIRIPKMQRKGSTLSFLPLSHILERGWVYYCLLRGVKVYLNLKPQEVMQSLREVRPNYMCNVPRFWEKAYIGVKTRRAEFSHIKEGVFSWAMAVGQSYNLDCKRVGKRPSLSLQIKYALADKLVFGEIKKRIGIERGKLFVIGGAAMEDKLLKFFVCIGVPIKYGYGLTETFATVACFEDFNYKIGTVGTPMPDVEVRIGDDDEILVKGKTITSGYYGDNDATSALLTDGWLHTGDAGMIDANGNLVVLDRIKDLFKTSNGKYVAPQSIEMRLEADEYIEQVVAIGNNRNFVTAIIVPSKERIEQYVQQNGIECATIDELLTDERIVQFYKNRVDSALADMAGYEQVKKFRLVKKGFSIESGEITSTLKLRRTMILHNYQHLIEEMYEK